MSITAATIAKPAFFDSLVSYKDQVPSKDIVGGAGHSSATLDDPDLCPPWPPLPFPHHLHALAGLLSSPLGALAPHGDGHCGNGSGPRPPLPRAL